MSIDRHKTTWAGVLALLVAPVILTAETAGLWQYQEPGHALYLNNAESAGIVLEDGQSALLAVEPDGEWVVAAVRLTGSEYESALTSHLIHASGSRTTVVIEGEKLFRDEEVVDGMVSYNFLMHVRDLELFQAASIWRVETERYSVEFPLENSRVAIDAAMAAVLAARAAETEDMAKAAATMQTCDQLAAHPRDTAAPLDGVTWADMDGAAAVAACEAALEMGNDLARLQFQLGRAYDRIGDARALAAMKTAALELEYPLAFSQLGRFYWEGKYTAQDIAKARGILKRGYALGNLLSGYDYARLLIRDGDGDEDIGAGQEVLQAIADKGHILAQRTYGQWMLEGAFGTRDYAAALLYLTKAAEGGDAEAAHTLAMIYRDGTGVSADPELYRAHLEKAANLGHAGAIETLALD